jgi:hypothetical protein
LPSVPVAAVLACIALVAVGGASRVGTVAAVLLVGAVLMERVSQPANLHMMPQNNAEEFFAPPAFARYLRSRAGSDRILLVPARRFPVTAKSGTLYGLNVVQDYEPLAPHEYQQFLSRLEGFNMDSPLFWGRVFPPPRDDLIRSLDMMATRFVVVESGANWLEGSNPRFVPIYEDGSVTILENLGALGRAYIVENTEVWKNPSEALARVQDPAFDPWTTVVIDRPIERPASAESADLPAEVAVTGVSPDEVILRVTSPRPAVVVLTDLYWPGWSALVDGGEAPIYRANFLFRGVAVPAGVHEVRFRYRPLILVLGAVTSSVAMGALVVAVLWARRRHMSSNRRGGDRSRSSPNLNNGKRSTNRVADTAPKWRYWSSGWSRSSARMAVRKGFAAECPAARGSASS